MVKSPSNEDKLQNVASRAILGRRATKSFRLAGTTGLGVQLTRKFCGALLALLVVAGSVFILTPPPASAAALCSGATATTSSSGGAVYATGQVQCTQQFYLIVESRVDGRTIYSQRFGPFSPSRVGRSTNPVPLAPGITYQSVLTVLNGTGAVLGTIYGAPRRLVVPTRVNLASYILNSSKVAKTGRLVSTDLVAASQGRTSSAGTYLGQTMLQNLVFLSFVHTYAITALESGGTGHSTGSLHYNGNAFDLGTIDGVYTSGRDPKSVEVINDLKGRLPSGSGFGQRQCGPTPPLPPGITTFEDACNHLHVQLPRGTS